MNYDGPDWPADLRAQFEKYVNGGGGLVVVHAADNAFPNWPAFNLMIGIGGWRNRNQQAGPYWYWKDGKVAPDDAPGPAGQHGARLPFQVTTRAVSYTHLDSSRRIVLTCCHELQCPVACGNEDHALRRREIDEHIDTFAIGIVEPSFCAG